MSIVDTVANALGGSPGNGEISGPLYTATNPAVANLLDRHPVVSARLALGDTAVRAHSARHEGAYLGFQEARKRADESKSDEAVAHHEARQVGQPVDAKVARRLLQGRQAAFDGLKRAERALNEASQLGGNTRFAFDQALNFIGRIPVEGKTIGTLAAPIKLPDKDLNSIVSTQRRVLASLAEEEADIKRAPLPLDDAIAIIRSKAAGAPPRIIIGPSGAEWQPPQNLLNAQSLLGSAPVEVDDTSGLVGWLFGDLLADRLEAEVRQKYIGVTKTYTPAERRKARAEIAVRRTKAEALEVAAILAAWKEGDYTVGLRKETTPMVLLGIETLVDAPQDNSGGWALLN